MFDIIGKRKVWFSLSGLLLAISVVSLIIWGLNLGIDFKGGALLEIKFKENRPASIEIEESLAPLNLGEVIVQPTEERGVILRFKDVTEDTHTQISSLLREKFDSQDALEENEPAAAAVEVTPVDRSGTVDLSIVAEPTLRTNKLEERRFESIGPTIGQELREKSFWAILTVLVAIVLYIAYVFRKVSKPVASWKYGLVAIATLFHDVLIVLGVFVFLGKFLNVEINTAFVAAILTILGYSVNDTIVVFDRIRENLFHSETSFEQTVNKSVNQTITRSVNTSLTTLLVLLAVFFFGGVTIKFFVLALIFGILIGTYSSIFIASPLVVVWQKWSER